MYPLAFTTVIQAFYSPFTTLHMACIVVFTMSLVFAADTPVLWTVSLMNGLYMSCQIIPFSELLLTNSAFP